MALDIVVTTRRWMSDPASRSLVDYIKQHEIELQVSGSIIYYDFPAYADYEAALFRPDILLLSPVHGFIAIRNFDVTFFQRSSETLLQIDLALGDFTSNLYSRLIRSRELRKGRTESIIPIHAVILSEQPETLSYSDKVESKICLSLESLGEFLQSIRSPPFTPLVISEVRSVVEGAKALAKSTKRVVENATQQPLASAMAKIEGDIANFDEKQRYIALVDVGGPARIRGLAGCGKTAILAMKAAHLHLNNPDQKILVTFYTKSLRATIKTLITKFFRIYSDSDPEWKMLHIRHGWGGSNTPGVYSDACSRDGIERLSFSDAAKLAKGSQGAFGAACDSLLATSLVREHYDHVLIDEGQDFPDSFYRLTYALTKGERDRKSIVWAYDELQDIMNIKIRQPEELFGLGNDGKPLVDLDRSSAHLPPGATNDSVLSKAYRNQRDVLVSAHALGFGVYGQIVQMLESAEHWEDVGYQVLSGPLVIGKKVEILRPDTNSPLHLPVIPGFPLIDSYCALDFNSEVKWIVDSVSSFIAGGLAPEEVLIVSLDDRNAKKYLSTISERLALAGFSSNNVIADPYNEPPFTLSGKITLSTVYRAKGNEAAAVIAIGVDAVETKTRGGRNKLFTAFTRSKAWLRVSGIGEPAKRVINELDMAVRLSPKITFNMPNRQQIDTIQRGFSRKQAAAQAARLEFLKKLRAAGFSDEEIENELQQVVSNE